MSEQPQKSKREMTVEELTALGDGPKLVFENLPTGKPHVSFSEIRVHQDCSYRHKLKFIDKVGEDLPGVHMDFGTAIHAACEEFLKTRVMDEKVFIRKLHELWKKNTQKLPDEYTVDSFKSFAAEGKRILLDVPTWMETQFPDWTYVDAEHMLYESIDETSHAFKGFIDGIIKCTGVRGKPLVWLLDWKSCGWGWQSEKKSDPTVTAQLVLYKNFWSTKMNIDPKDVRCGFVLLKRAAKPGKHCELVTVSVGEVTTKRTLKVVTDMITDVKRGKFVKNRTNCKWCEYYKTPFCT